jgi:hypothetical protein
LARYSNFKLISSHRKFYCTVGLTVLEWGFVLLHRQAARGALTAGDWGYHLYLTAESTLPLSDGWVYCTLTLSDG